MALEQFYKNFLKLTDEILPTLPSSQQSVYIQLFTRTVAVGKDKCQISYNTLAELTNLSWQTVKRALKELIKEKGLIELVKSSKPQTAQEYKVHWPVDEKKLKESSRDPDLLLSDIGIENYEGLLEKLTPEDRNTLKLIFESTPAEEIAMLRRKAKKEINPGESIEDKVRELLLIKNFGPERLRKYFA